jgi:MFS family permease
MEVNKLGKAKANLVWMLISLFYAYQYTLRVIPNIIMPILVEKYKIDAGGFGAFSGIYYIGYTLMMVPIGVLLDRLGTKRVLPVCIALASLGILPLAYSNQWYVVLIGRLFVGVGAAAAIVGAFKIIRMAFSDAQFSRKLGITVTIGLMGAVYGGKPLNMLMDVIGWNRVIDLTCLLGLILALGVFLSVPQEVIKKDEKSHRRSAWGDIKEVFTNKKIIFIGLLAGLMVGPLEGFADAWGTEFLKTVYSLEADVASELPSYIFLGMMAGCAILGWVAEKTKAYYGVTIVSALVMGISFTYILLGQSNNTILQVLFTVIGILSAYQILMVYKVGTYVPERLIGITTSFANTVIMIFGFVFHNTIGGLMNYLWDGTIAADGTYVYDEYSFKAALSVIPLCLIVAGIGFILISLQERVQRKRKIKNKAQ